MDPDPIAQEMMLEQFVAEVGPKRLNCSVVCSAEQRWSQAKSARAVFHVPSFASTADKASSSENLLVVHGKIL